MFKKHQIHSSVKYPSDWQYIMGGVEDCIVYFYNRSKILKSTTVMNENSGCSKPSINDKMTNDDTKTTQSSSLASTVLNKTNLWYQNKNHQKLF